MREEGNLSYFKEDTRDREKLAKTQLKLYQHTTKKYTFSK